MYQLNIRGIGYFWNPRIVRIHEVIQLKYVVILFSDNLVNLELSSLLSMLERIDKI